MVDVLNLDVNEKDASRLHRQQYTIVTYFIDCERVKGKSELVEDENGRDRMTKCIQAFRALIVLAARRLIKHVIFNIFYSVLPILSILLTCEKLK